VDILFLFASELEKKFLDMCSNGKDYIAMKEFEAQVTAEISAKGSRYAHLPAVHKTNIIHRRVNVLKKRDASKYCTIYFQKLRAEYFTVINLT
jgi:hypothetical protein